MKSLKVFFVIILFLGLIFSFQESLAETINTCEDVCDGIDSQYNFYVCIDDFEDNCSSYPKFDGNKCWYDCATGSSGALTIEDCDSDCVCIKKTNCDSSENNCFDSTGCSTCEAISDECTSDQECCQEPDALLCDTDTELCYNPDNNFSCISNRDCYSNAECMSGNCDLEGTGECECSDRGGMCVNYDSHCAGDLRCNDDYSVCYDGNLDEAGKERCYHNSECESNSCNFNAEGTEGVCLGVDRGKECEDDTHCSSGLLCSGIYCYDSTETLNDGAECYHNDECSSEICDWDEIGGEGIGKCISTDDNGDISSAKKSNGSVCSNDEQCVSGYCRVSGEYEQICIACRTKNESCAEPSSAIPCCDGLNCERSKCRVSGYVALTPGSCEYYCEEGGEMPEGQVCICNPLGADSFEDIINNIIDFIYKISLAVVPLMIVWAGSLYVTSGGNPEQITKAKNIIIYTLAGFSIVLLSKGFTVIIKQLLGS